MFDQKLARVLNFTEEDLTANRQGYMTKTQRSRLRRNVMSNPSAILIAPLTWLLIYTCAVIFNIAHNGELDGQLLACGLPILLVAFALIAFYIWTQRKVNADLHKGDVVMVEGEIALELRRVGNFHLAVDGLAFPVPPVAATVLKIETIYRVYYAPHTKYILSAERMQDKA